MAVNVQRFRKAYTEFRETEPDVIRQKINLATARTSSDAFGDDVDEAIMLLAAHLIAISPHGEKVRLQKDPTKTIYMQELKRMRREATMGMGRVI